MKNKIIRRVLIVAVILAANALVFASVGSKIVVHYRESDNRKLATIIGVLLEEKGESLEKESAIMNLLQDKISLQECDNQAAQTHDSFCAYYYEGVSLLKKYGYLTDDYADAATQDFVLQIATLLIVILLADIIVFVVIYEFGRYKTHKNLVELQKYLQRIANSDYDLELESNSENTFSLLRNELYKIAVTLREAAEQNRKTAENLETALEDISHQLRTPLTALQITLDNLQDGKNLSEKSRQEMLSAARRQVAGMTELVVTLLNLAKFDNKTIKLNPRPTQLNDIVQKAIDKISILAELSEVEIVVKGNKKAIISCDAAWQTEAIMNVIKNCVEFSPAGEKVEVNIEDSPLFAKIIIIDHGPGISKADQKRIFRRFYQAAGASSDHVGIGLNFAKTIIENEYGRIVVDSEMGEGAKFTITYPKN